MSLVLDHLPPLVTFRITALALEPQRLPPLPTTAFHGALGSLEGLDALRPRAEQPSGQGVTDRPPSPLVIAPSRHERRAPSLELGAGDTVSFRLTLIGHRAMAGHELVLQRVEAALRRGLGVSLTDRTRRPPLLLVEVARVELPRLPSLEQGCALRFVTPVRLTDGGSIARDIDAPLLWRSLLRRADTLSRCYGGGPLVDALELEPPFEVVDRRLEQVSVTRYSSRQGAEMTWPGQVGSLLLQGDLAPVAPLLTFGAAVQLGKATTFGLGLYWLLPAHAHAGRAAARRRLA